MARCAAIGMAMVVGMNTRHRGFSRVLLYELTMTIRRRGNSRTNSSCVRSPPSLSSQTPQIARMFASPRLVSSESDGSKIAGLISPFVSLLSYEN